MPRSGEQRRGGTAGIGGAASSSPIGLVVESTDMTEEHTRRTLLVDAFADEPFGGVATGVVPDAGDLSGAQMATMAGELGTGTTAFVTGNAGGTRRIRAFAGTDECDAGGREIVAVCAEFGTGEGNDGMLTIETSGGLVDAEIDDDTVWVHGTDPESRAVEVDYDAVARALDADPATLRDIGADLPAGVGSAAIGSTGESFLLVPVNFLSALGSIEPDPEAITSLLAAHDAAGMVAFTFDTLSPDATLHARFLDGGAGDPIDLATGAGACATYLHRSDAFETPPEEIVLEWGHLRDRPGTIRVIPGDPVRIGGRGAVSLEGRLAVPEDDEEILGA